MEGNGIFEAKVERSPAGSDSAVANLGALLRFPMQDAEWRNKFLWGGGLVFLGFIIPLVPLLAVGGYALKVMRQSVRGEEPVLPEWDDWGDLIIEGLKGAALILAYLVPGYVLLIGGFFLVFFAQFLIFPLSTIGASSGDPEAFVGTLLAAMGISIGASVLQIILMFAALLLLLLGFLPLPVAIGHYLHEGELSAGLRLREIWGLMKVNKVGFVAAWVIYLGLTYTLSLPALLAYFTIVLICLMPFLIAPVTFYVYLIGAAAFGQHYRESRLMWEERAARTAAAETAE